LGNVYGKLIINKNATLPLERLPIVIPFPLDTSTARCSPRPGESNNKSDTFKLIEEIHIMSTNDSGRERELQSALESKMAENRSIADTFQIEDGVTIVTTEQKTAFDKNMVDIKEIKSLISGLQDLRSVEEWASQPAADSVAAYAAAGLSTASSYRGKSLGDLFLNSPEFKALQNGKAGANMVAPFELSTSNVGAFSSKSADDIFSAMPSGTPGSFGTIERDSMVTPPTRTRRVRDLFPARTTTAAVIEYFRMLGFTTPETTAVNAASSVAQRDGNDFALKPQSSFQFEGHQAPIRTLAHWEAAHRNVLADEPQLRSIIDNELLYGLRLQEDFQILNGDGNGENLLGILNTTGVQTYEHNPANDLTEDNYGDAIRRAATLAFLAYYEPSGVVVHPNDWEAMELTKNAQGSYLMAVSMQVGAEARIWRMPVIDTPAIDEGTALVGAFGTGAQIYDREQASIRISEQHSDFFVRNAIVVLAEERLALAVKRPESFVKVSFDVAP
jgi:HK97 family phage major capsid protein